MIKIGTKVKCIKKEGWNTYKQNKDLEDKSFPTPVYGEIYTIINFTELEYQITIAENPEIEKEIEECLGS